MPPAYGGEGFPVDHHSVVALLGLLEHLLPVEVALSDPDQDEDVEDGRDEEGQGAEQKYIQALLSILDSKLVP